MNKFILFIILSLLFQNSCEQTISKSDNRNSRKVVNKLGEMIENKSSARREKQENKKVIDREKLAEKVKKIDEDTAETIRNEDTEISTLDTPFLRNGKIYRIKETLPTRPVITYLGCTDKDFCAVLNADPQAFFEFVEKANVSLEKRDLRLRYVEVYLETVESKNKRLEILQSVKDIESRPGLSDEQRQKFEEFQTKYREIITAPKVTDSFPSTAVFFVIKEQNLVKLELTITSDGKIQMKEIVLEKDLLIPYAL